MYIFNEINFLIYREEKSLDFLSNPKGGQSNNALSINDIIYYFDVIQNNK